LRRKTLRNIRNIRVTEFTYQRLKGIATMKNLTFNDVVEQLFSAPATGVPEHQATGTLNTGIPQGRNQPQDSKATSYRIPEEHQATGTPATGILQGGNGGQESEATSHRIPVEKATTTGVPVEKVEKVEVEKEGNSLEERVEKLEKRFQRHQFDHVLEGLKELKEKISSRS